MFVSKFVASLHPDKKTFFNHFSLMVDNLNEISCLLNKAMDTLHSEKRQILLQEIAAHKNKSALASHEMVKILHQNFITPLDRLDILSLSKNLNYIADSAASVACRIIIFDIQQIPPIIFEYSVLFQKAIHQLSIAICNLNDLSNHHLITEACFIINTYQAKASDFLELALQKLYIEVADPIEIIKIKIIYEIFQQSIDYCKATTTVIASLVIKSV